MTRDTERRFREKKETFGEDVSADWTVPGHVFLPFINQR